jgi:hypothetical protein
MQIG